MNIREKIFRRLLPAVALMVVANVPAKAQMDLTLDTLECAIIGFNVGAKVPSSSLSFATAPDGSRSQDATMAALYRPPYMDYGINAFYKFKTNWLLSADVNLWFGSNNLKYRRERMGSIFTHDSIVIGESGTDAAITCYNRGLSFQGGVGRVFPLSYEKNPNSGIMARLCAGYLRQQTIFMAHNEHAPQIEGDYALLYDHQRHGLLLTEGLGFWYMSNHSNLLNFYVAFELSESWSWSTRDYVIDTYLGLNGKDNNRYFDLVYSIKLCWMFPLRGKTTHDYYFY